VYFLDQKVIDNLSDKIWQTRKCRINTSERLIFTNMLAQFLINYYTLVILSLSIWSFYSPSKNDNLSFITVIASLFLFAITIAINSLNFKERIINLKSCYIHMDELNTELKLLKGQLSNIDANDAIQIFNEIRKKYTSLLLIVENHTTYDRLKFMIENDQKITTRQFANYYFIKLVFLISFLFLFLIPLTPIIFIIKGMI
jgi:SMODS and SLOG-associating 2TM effector domain family 5